MRNDKLPCSNRNLEAREHTSQVHSANSKEMDSLAAMLFDTDLPTSSFALAYNYGHLDFILKLSTWLMILFQCGTDKLVEKLE
ncbi:hypothetical protein VNO77_12845 [Canavalia gladiata]|uniref:Uncharacterized protein n=1 Tax=Canavalia gladiata TaxID=3824 RepID=A0AAN9QRA9_CANGL